MSKHSRRSGGAPPAWLGKRRVAVAITLVLMCIISVSLLAQVSSRKKGNGALGEVSVASLAPGSPSKEYIYAGARLIATEEPDTQPPVFPNGCPATMNVAATYSCPYATSAGVTYTNPQATDNNPGVTVSCNPPSGSSFSVGATTVTCTATDAAGNTATCSFAVNVFSACLVDDSNAGNVVLFNASTGDYRYCCNGSVVATGRSAPTVLGCDVTIHHVKGNRTVHISVTGSGQGSGSAYIQTNSSPSCQITDSTMAGNACNCP